MNTIARSRRCAWMISMATFLMLLFAGAAMAQDADGDGTPDASDACPFDPTPSCSQCLVVDEVCTDSVDCCSFLCADDGLGTLRCQELNGCRPADEACSQDSDCCNQAGRCNDPSTVGECLLLSATFGRCSQLSGNLTSGEICADGFPTGSSCCGGASNCLPTTDGVDRCDGSGSSECTMDGNVCEFPDQCCSGTCLQDEFGIRMCVTLGPDADGDGTPDATDACPFDPTPSCSQCLVVDEVCTGDVDCCSFLCADDGLGTLRCQELDGCRPADEACSQDNECCNQVGECNDPSTVGECQLLSPSFGRCSLLNGNPTSGEICADGFPAGSNCCGGASICMSTIDGVDRCYGAGFSQCVVEGSACSFSDQCCTGICYQAGTGARTCLAAVPVPTLGRWPFMILATLVSVLALSGLANDFGLRRQ
jgi:hypothetical protein